MESLYEVSGISRQAFHEWLLPGRREQNRTPPAQALALAEQARSEFLPGSGARTLYFFIRNKRPEYSSRLSGWGKHRFEALCLSNGLRVETRRFVPKTTVRGDFVYPNRIEGLELDNIDQVWVSDICYLFSVDGKLLGYATSLLDLYSRMLLGLVFSQSMRACETAGPVLQQAFDARRKSLFEGLVFHSDGGKQYIEKHFVSALRQRNIESSMAESCYENAFAEAFNDTLKNHMLSSTPIHSFHQLKKMEGFLKHCYNHHKPHSALQNQTPIEFEQLLPNLQPCQRTKLLIKPISKNSFENR